MGSGLDCERAAPWIEVAGKGQADVLFQRQSIS